MAGRGAVSARGEVPEEGHRPRGRLQLAQDFRHGFLRPMLAEVQLAVELAALVEVEQVPVAQQSGRQQAAAHPFQD